MAKGYRPVVRDQGFLLPPDMREWLPGDHPVWLVIGAVGQMDTGAFHALRKTGGAGAAGYDPDMLLTVLVWAYAHKVTSSRQMERLCQADVAFRVICGGNLPDHSTLARFRQEFPAAVGDLFAQVLVLCARLGMGQLGTVALDGTKVAGSASKAANRTEETLRKLAREAVAAHAAADEAEDGLFGAGRRGDEVPPDAWSPRRRGERIAAALADLEAEREAARRAEEGKAAEFRARMAAGQATGPAPKQAAADLAREKVARETARQQAKVEQWERARAAGRPVPRRPQAPQEYCRVRRAQAKLEAALARAAGAGRQAAEEKAAGKDKAAVRNVTDPDSRLMPVRGGGFIQGYNAQNVTSEDGLVIATELTDDPADCRWYEPMIARAQDAAGLMDARRPGGPDRDGGIGLVLADAGYCSEGNLTCHGPDRLIAVGKRRDLEKAARAAAADGDSTRDGDRDDSTALAAMTARLATEDGITAYRQRGHIAETPHGHIKHNMGFRQLTMRGKTKASAEWAFTCAVHNLLKAISTGHLTSQALAAAR
jgi:transposase